MRIPCHLLCAIALVVGLHNPALAVETVPGDVVPGANQFAVDLYRAMTVPKKNLFFSPFSVSSTLAMTSLGAWGKTLQEMHRTLHLSMTSERIHSGFATLIEQLDSRAAQGGYTLSIANGIWFAKKQPVKEEFLEAADKQYRARAEQLDFAKNPDGARSAINAWIARKTSGKIAEAIPNGGANAGTSLVLANALYFMGNWEYPFDEKKTASEKFFIDKKKSVTVPMMNRRAPCRYAESADALVASLPYKKGELSLVIILPKKAEGFERFERGLSAAQIEQWMKKASAREMMITIPKFTMTGAVRLNDILSKMGMPSAFGPKADFSAMASGLFISNVFHKASIEVNEKGTEAAASTIATMTKNGGSRTYFRANRPFIYLIRDMKSGAILFMGRMMNPKA